MKNSTTHGNLSATKKSTTHGNLSTASHNSTSNRNDDDKSLTHLAVPSLVRSHVDCNVQVKKFAGTLYQQNPCTFLQGDTAYWKYANDLLVAVEIDSVIPPSGINPQHRYSWKIISSGKQRDGYHCELFIPVIDGKVLFDEKGIFHRQTKLFSWKGHQQKRLNPNLADDLLAKFGTMESANFNTKKFLAGSATLAINSDEISAFKTFYGALNIQLAAAHSRNTMYLPPFGDLSPYVPLRTQIYPPSHFSGHSTVKFHLDFVGTLIHNLLDRHSLTEKAPKARMHIDEVIHSSSDGWDVLEYLSKKTIPFLGRLDLDVDELIQNLQVSQGVHVKDFLSQVQRVS